MRGLRSLLSFFARTPHNNAANTAGKKSESTVSWEKYEGPTTNQPTKAHVQTCLTRDFSTLTREIYHGSSRSYPHETRISRVTRSVTGRVGSTGFQTLAGWVGSGQEVFKISWVGSGRVGSGRAKTSRNSRGLGRVGSRRLEVPTGRADPT